MRKRNYDGKVGISSSDKARIIILIGALLVVAGSMWYMGSSFSGKEEESKVPVVPWRPGSGRSQGAKGEPARPTTPGGAGLGDRETGKKSTSGGSEAGKQEEGGIPLEPKEETPVPSPEVVDPDPPRPHSWDEEKILSQVEDKTEGLDPKAFACLLHKVRTTAPSQREEEDIKWYTQSDLIEKSEALRGKWVHIVGTVYRDLYTPRKVEWTGPSGVYQVYSTFVFDVSARAVRVYTIYNQPPKGGKAVFPEDEVETRGLYFKLQAYENVKGERVAVPVVVAERLRKYKEEPGEESFWVKFGMPGIIVLAGLVTLIVLLAGGMRGFGAGKKRRRREKEEESG